MYVFSIAAAKLLSSLPTLLCECNYVNHLCCALYCTTLLLCSLLLQFCVQEKLRNERQKDLQALKVDTFTSSHLEFLYVVGASLSEPHTSELNGGISLIYIYHTLCVQCTRTCTT